MISKLRFDFTPDQIENLGKEQFTHLEQRLNAIGKAKSPSSVFDLEFALAEFSNALSIPLFLKYVSPDTEVRKASDLLETQVQKLMVDIFTREDLFHAVDMSEKTLKGKSPVQDELIKEYLFNFRKNGLGLSPELRKTFIEKKKRLVELESQFSQNLMSEHKVLAFTKEEMAGLPDSFIQSLNKTQDGKYEITLSYPHVTPFMENVISTEARKEVSFHFNNRGGVKNKALLEEAISLRHELAQLLGYKNHAELILSRRMALKPETAIYFLEDLAKKLKALGEKERADLLKLKREILRDESPLKSYEWRFLHNQLLKRRYTVDPLQLQEYFPLETVLKGMFDIFQTVLGVTFKKDSSAEVWHSSVQKFEVWKNNALVSHFYMDLFPREGKYGHAAAFTLISAYRQADSSYQIPFSSIVANFSSPTSEKPSLLLHSEVETLFHEFGHIMHQVLTRASYPSFSGTGVKTDFVEAPSQMFENWVWDKEMLKRLSGHYLRPTETLPEELIKKMLAAKNLNQGLHNLRQISFGFFDFDLHTQAQIDSTEAYSQRMANVLGIPIQSGTLPQASFGHLMGGYDAGYYGYLWAEVFAQDMFTRFEKEGLLNPKTGEDYRKWILEPGGEKQPSELLRGFLGREPNSDSFLKGLGF